MKNHLPNSNTDASTLEEWELRIRDFEERLRPAAQRPVDITRPGWLDQLRADVPSLDEAGVREQVQQLLDELIPAYAKGDNEASRSMSYELPPNSRVSDDIAAYATRRADSIQAAKKVSFNAEPKFPKEAAIKYNLACYFCQTGDIQGAKNYLKEAFDFDLSWRIAPLEEEDLKPLWESP
jgi:hypothetical protein